MFKDVNKTAILEITFGVALAIILINVLAGAFRNTPVLGTMLGHNLEDAEDVEENSEDLEHARGRRRAGWRERRAARQQGREDVSKAKRKRKKDKIKNRFKSRVEREEVKDYDDREQEEELPQEDYSQEEGYEEGEE